MSQMDFGRFNVGGFEYETGRVGDVDENWESPGKIGRIDRSHLTQDTPL